jgi:S1-C subfamily serine protease
MSVSKSSMPSAVRLSFLNCLGWAWFVAAPAAMADIATTLVRVKPAVVGVGTFHPLRTPRMQLAGTGFVVADGRYLITHAHVLPAQLAVEKGEFLAIFVPRGNGNGDTVRKVYIYVQNLWVKAGASAAPEQSKS